MKILTYKDLILGFIKQNLENKEHQKQVRQILGNENSVFLYSQKFFAFIKESIEPDELDTFQNLLKQFSDYGQNIKSSSNSQNFGDEILHIFSATQDKVVVSISCNQPSQEIQNVIPNIAILSQQQKPNYHWLVVNLAILHPNKVTLRCFEFSTNAEINEFFENAFIIPKAISMVNIFDTQCNLNHDKFDYVVNNSLRVSYFTKFASREKSQFDRKDEIKNHFGNSAKVFLSNRGQKAHGRRVVFESIIITSDEDFWNLEVNGSDWNIDVEYSEQTARNWLNRTNQYSEFR